METTTMTIVDDEEEKRQYKHSKTWQLTNRMKNDDNIICNYDNSRKKHFDLTLTQHTYTSDVRWMLVSSRSRTHTRSSWLCQSTGRTMQKHFEKKKLKKKYVYRKKNKRNWFGNQIIIDALNCTFNPQIQRKNYKLFV